jgi:hypothetical protein
VKQINYILFIKNETINSETEDLLEKILKIHKTIIIIMIYKSTTLYVLRDFCD